MAKELEDPQTEIETSQSETDKAPTKAKKEVKLKKVELECVDKENDLYITTDLLPTDVVVCELEVNDVQYNKLKKKNEVVPETQLREYAGGFFEHIYVNSEGYNESLKLTIKGKK